MRGETPHATLAFDSDCLCSEEEHSISVNRIWRKNEYSLRICKRHFIWLNFSVKGIAIKRKFMLKDIKKNRINPKKTSFVSNSMMPFLKIAVIL
jgi:hypothetical protein